MRLGYNITLYDKFDDAAVLVKIIKSWHDDTYINITCNHLDAEAKLIDVEYDSLTIPRPMPNSDGFASRKNPWLTKGEATKNYARRVRAAESVRAGCKAMLDTNCDYVIHCHADCWTLKKKFVMKIIANLVTNGKVIAVRGKGLEYCWHPFRNCNAFGMIDDNIFIFDRRWCKEQHVFDYNPVALLYHKYSVHAMLGLVFGIKIGLDKMWFFRDMHTLCDAFGNPSSSLNPVSWDDDYKILHVNSSTLPIGWGKKIQANELWFHDIDLLSGYQDWSVYNKLGKANAKLNRKLFLLGFSKTVRKNLSTTMKERYLKNATPLTLPKNLFHIIGTKILNLLYKIPQDATVCYREKYGIDEFEIPNWAWGLYHQRI